MALTGELSDLSLAELIEFFCNQRKTGRLKVIYPHGAGYFYLHAGSVVHARIGPLRGIDAVYSALTLPNASFTFSPSVEARERTINQPWTQVVLEGLRRMDEGIIPGEAFPPGYVADPDEEESEGTTPSEARSSHLPAFLSGFGRDSDGGRNKLATAGVVAIIVLVVAIVGVPAGWYSRNKPVQTASQPPTVMTPSEASSSTKATNDPGAAESSAPDNAAANSDAALLARREREARERARAREARIDASSAAPKSSLQTPDPNTAAAKKLAGAVPAQKKVTVQVSYDENGRVTQASGGDATALRIARQKRFPVGKAGSATVTIPIN
ncbi:MAG TPA: DUF4388 domain-containing protein [Pyrinomonadaceae bacterium]|jgi:hypothetical protein